MITRLELTEFKSFAGDGSSMPLAPITLVYGPNSAGKSTLIQSLALLKQSLVGRPRSADPPELVFRGDLVDLGSFAAAVNGHDRGKAIGLALGFLDPTPAVGSGPLAEEEIFAGVRFTSAEGDRSRQELARLGDSDDDVAFARDDDGTFRLASKQDHGIFLRLIRSRRDLHIRAGTSEDLRNADNLLLVEAAVEAALAKGHTPTFLSAGLFPSLPVPGFLSPNRDLDLTFALWFEEYLYARARVVIEILERLAYLGPLRSLPARFQAVGGRDVSDVGFTGEHTTQLLATRPELLRAVNGALEKLEVQYELDVLRLVPPKTDADAQIEIGALVTTQLVHRRSRIAVTPRDVGFGISQMLPVVVQLLVNERSTICVEQPEVHIHPRLQARLADLFIESARRDGLRNQVIIETHSEALVGRIQLRIAEGALSADDVSVLYIDDRRGEAALTVLPLDDEGYFVRDWPAGFFVERQDDELARSAALLRRSDDEEAEEFISADEA